MMYKHSALTFFICSTRAFSGLIFQAIALTRIIKKILTIFILQAEHLLTCTVQLNQTRQRKCSTMISVNSYRPLLHFHSPSSITTAVDEKHPSAVSTVISHTPFSNDVATDCTTVSCLRRTPAEWPIAVSACCVTQQPSTHHPYCELCK